MNTAERILTVLCPDCEMEISVWGYTRTRRQGHLSKLLGGLSHHQPGTGGAQLGY